MNQFQEASDRLKKAQPRKYKAAQQRVTEFDWSQSRFPSAPPEMRENKLDEILWRLRRLEQVQRLLDKSKNGVV